MVLGFLLALAIVSSISRVEGQVRPVFISETGTATFLYFIPVKPEDFVCTKDGNNLKFGGRHQSKSLPGGRSLEISDVTKSDVGRYSCWDKDKATDKKEEYSLIVIGDIGLEFAHKKHNLDATCVTSLKKEKSFGVPKDIVIFRMLVFDNEVQRVDLVEGDEDSAKTLKYKGNLDTSVRFQNLSCMVTAPGHMTRVAKDVDITETKSFSNSAEKRSISINLRFFVLFSILVNGVDYFAK